MTNSAANALQSRAFPKLTDAELGELQAFATLSTYQGGETLFEAGERDFRFFVIKSGEVEITERSSGHRKTVTVHEPGEFTGDVDMLTGNPSLVSATAKGDVEVLEVSAEDLRRIVSEVPKLSDTLLQAFLARREHLEASDFVGLRVVGSSYSQDAFRLRDFLAKNRVPYTWLDVEREGGYAELLARFGVGEEETPVVTFGDDAVLKNPSNRELAEKIGLTHTPNDTLFDLAVIGAGPAGLAAAVYGASEGLKTVVLERHAPGGQAGHSSRIENYLGFPTGLSGEELADRATLQARKFGAQLSTPAQVTRLAVDSSYLVLHLDNDTHLTAKTVLIATGADYRKLDVPGRERFDGAGVYYAATTTEAQLCAESEVVVVGGGNSAGQAAVFLSEYASRVHLLLRGGDLREKMSSYLATRIEKSRKIEVHLHTEITKMSGEAGFEAVDLVNNQTDERITLETSGVFTFIGAVPRTDWLPIDIETDDKGFVKTGPELATKLNGRAPYLLETSVPGVFAAGDVRLGSVKRVASAVGEGSMAVQFVHQVLVAL